MSFALAISMVQVEPVHPVLCTRQEITPNLLIATYIQDECNAGCIIRLDDKEAEGVQVSRFGVIPKPQQLGKWRLIMDLSSPKHNKHNSVNDGISPSLCSVSYASVDDAVRGLGENHQLQYCSYLNALRGRK